MCVCVCVFNHLCLDPVYSEFTRYCPIRSESVNSAVRLILQRREGGKEAEIHRLEKGELVTMFLCIVASCRPTPMNKFSRVANV